MAGPRYRGRLGGLLLAGLIFCGLATVAAQRYAFFEPVPDRAHYDGRFTFARLKYESGPGGYYYRGVPAWAHGFANTENGVSAEHQLMMIVNEISAMHPRMDETNVFALDDPELFKFPVAYMTEAGYWTLTDREALSFREYLKKGGFVIFDDFRDPPRGGGGWEQFEANMERILPNARIEDLDVSHPIFHSFFQIFTLDLIPQYYDAGRPIIRGIYEDNDHSKRLMAVINFNTDISHFWEYSGTGMAPVAKSNEAFELGVDYLIYGLTH